jgi:hypothetical protein
VIAIAGEVLALQVAIAISGVSWNSPLGMSNRDRPSFKGDRITSNEQWLNYFFAKAVLSTLV